MTCSKSGYKRGNNINIYNNLTESINFAGTYQDSGKIYEHGAYTLPPNQNTTWTFVKHAGSATGSNGIVVWNLPSASLVLFYENPWSNYNFAGACLYGRGPERVTPDQLRKIYKDLYQKHPNKWPSNCVLADNWYLEELPFWRTLKLEDSNYKVGIATKYEFIDYAATDDCYTQELDVVVSKK